jgi:hypothetical protein
MPFGMQQHGAGGGQCRRDKSVPLVGLRQQALVKEAL